MAEKLFILANSTCRESSCCDKQTYNTTGRKNAGTFVKCFLKRVGTFCNSEEQKFTVEKKRIAGIVLTACLPIHKTPWEFVGVACVDILMRDMIGDLTAFQDLDVAYTFMLDQAGAATGVTTVPQNFFRDLCFVAWIIFCRTLLGSVSSFSPIFKHSCKRRRPHRIMHVWCGRLGGDSL